MKRTLWASFAVLFLTFLCVASYGGDDGFSKAETAKMHIDAAKKMLFSGKKIDLRPVRVHLKKAMDLDPKNFEAPFLMGLTFYFEENRGGTMRYMMQARKLNPKHQQVNYYMGRAELDLGHLDKALKYLKSANDAKEGFFENPLQQIMVTYDLGVCYSKMGKGKEAVRILQPLADGGKFEQFGRIKDPALQRYYKVYFEGYLFTGQAFTALGEFAKGDPYYEKAIANVKQLNEGKMSSEVWNPYLFNKYRVPIPSQGQIQGNAFVHAKSKFKVVKPDKWDFVFYHPECFQQYKDADAAYKQASQAACAAVWLIEKNKEREYEGKIKVDIEAWDLQISLTIAGESVALSSPKDVARTTLEVKKKVWEPFRDPEYYRLRIVLPRVDKFKLNREYRAAGFKGCFKHKENPDIERDIEFFCFVSKKYSFFVEIYGDHGVLKEYYRDLAKLKRSIRVLE